METLLQLRAQFGGSELANANEAATRLLIIDRILEKVLGWPKETFNPESPARDGQKTEWIDYHLECGGLARLVVEAKRKGRSFTLPHSKTKRARQVSMKTARSYGKNLRDAL
ncbi:MAG: hypothetical protein R3F61_14480, partial [Myxococcota bacterium]